MRGWQDLVEFHEAHTSAFELHGEWAGRVTGCGCPGFYLVERGSLLACVDGERYRLGTGDLLLLPRSVDHVLASSANVVLRSIERIAERSTFRRGRYVFGRGKSGLRLRSAAFAGRPLCADWLPRAVVLRAAERPRSLRYVVRALVDELGSGRAPALCSLAEALFIKALDTSVDARQLDADILRVVTLARSAPERFGSIRALAEAAGLSRSRFHDRFALAYGQPPMRWLRQLRMEQARAELLAGRVSVAEVAERFGYSSESAFRAAYRRVLGKGPRIGSRGRRA